MTSENYLENKTFHSISNEIYQILAPLDDRIALCNKLKLYRFVDEIYQLHTGKYTRWMFKKDNILKIGGIVTNVKFLDNGTHILIYNTNQKKFVQIKFDDVLLFQKLTFEEEVLLYAQRGNEIKKVIG